MSNFFFLASQPKKKKKGDLRQAGHNKHPYVTNLTVLSSKEFKEAATMK